MGACWDACPPLTALTPPSSFCDHQKTLHSFLPRWPYGWKSFGCGLFSFQSNPAGSSMWPTPGPQETCSSVLSAAAKALMSPNVVTSISFATRQAASATDFLLYIFSSWVTHQFHFFPLNISSSLLSSLKASLTGHEMRRKPPNPTIVRKACLCT